MQTRRDEHVLAVFLFLSLALHAAVFAFAGFRIIPGPQAPKPRGKMVLLTVMPSRPEKKVPEPIRPAARALAERRGGPVRVRQHTPPAAAATQHRTAFMDAPPAPSAQEWTLAATYTLKNSKRYRYTWGQQVRSMMGTAVEGPDQGMVRFRVEIGPDGTLARVDTLWSTSDVAERLARKAIARMPPLPPTPTGKPLIFEKTIAFDAFTPEAPPVYADDCLPDPPAFQDPFAWDGTSPQVRVEPQPISKTDSQALAECLKQLPQDSIEAESAHDQRQLDRWESSKLGR